MKISRQVLSLFLACFVLWSCSIPSLAAGPAKLPAGYKTRIGLNTDVGITFSSASETYGYYKLAAAGSTYGSSTADAGGSTYNIGTGATFEQGNTPAGTKYMAFTTASGSAISITYTSKDLYADSISSVTGTFKSRIYTSDSYGNSKEAVMTKATLLVNSVAIKSFTADSNGTATISYSGNISNPAQIGLKCEYSTDKISTQTGWHPEYTPQLCLSYTDSLSITGDITTPGDTIPDIVQEQMNTNRKLNTIISWIGDFFGNLIEAIKGLFVPSETDMNSINEKFSSLMQTKLGFIYQCYNLIDTAFKTFENSKDSDDHYFTIPAQPAFETVDGTSIQLWNEPIKVDIAANAFVQAVQTIMGTLVIMITGWAFVSNIHHMFEAFIAGKSYWEYAKGDKDDSDGSS